MDIARDPKPRTRKRIIQWSVGALALIGVTMALRNLEPAAPAVDAATVWMDTVMHGTMVRQVRGPGTLVPEQMRWITALTAGRVEQIIVLPGTEIDEGTVIIRMSNPDVDIALLQARQALNTAEATLIQTESNLETSRLTQLGLLAQLRNQLQNAQRDQATNQRLYDTNPELVAATELARTRDAVDDLQQRVRLEEEQTELLAASAIDQVNAQRININSLTEIVDFNRNRVASMEVTAGVSGVLAELPLDEGQWVQSGGTLARVVQPGRLKAEVRIPQTQAQDIAAGQVAYIDTRNDTIVGQVVRIDPSVQNGTVTIDVALPARPSAERSSGPEHRRQRGDPAAGRRDVRRTSRIRSGESAGGYVQARRRRSVRGTRERDVGGQFGQRDRSVRGTAGGGHRDLVGHVQLGRIRSGPLEELGGWPAFQPFAFARNICGVSEGRDDGKRDRARKRIDSDRSSEPQ